MSVQWDFFFLTVPVSRGFLLFILDKSNFLEQIKLPSEEEDSDEDDDGRANGHKKFPIVNQDVHFHGHRLKLKGIIGGDLAGFLNRIYCRCLGKTLKTIILSGVKNYHFLNNKN